MFEWDEGKKAPLQLYRKAAEAGLLGGIFSSKWPTEFCGRKIIGGVTPEEFDLFHVLILQDELCRPGSAGLLNAFAGICIGLPPVITFGPKHMIQRIAPSILAGEKYICLAVTEPYGGSDVANIRTEAKRTPDGKFFIVNGEKKWITNGVFADYFTVAVRTGGPGIGGISLLLVERVFPGVKTSQMNCSGIWCSGTSYITFEDVKVPVENLIGKENQGFKCIMVDIKLNESFGCVLILFSVLGK